jgi:hypothetical protein
MMFRVTSRPLSHLAVFALTTIAYPQIGHTAEHILSSSVANLDQEFVFALLTPMSRLVQSPYADPAAVENPMRVSVKPSPTTEVIQSVIDKNAPATLKQEPMDALEMDAIEPAPRIEITPVEPADGANLGAALTMPAPLRFNPAFAIAGR